jgi:hypothetical protein
MCLTDALLGAIAETALKDHCRKWRKIGLSTDAVDREKAKEAVYQIYSQSNTRPPSLFVWVDSPLQGAIAVALLQTYRKDGAYASVTAHSCEPAIGAYYGMIEERLQRQLNERNDAPFWAEARGHLQELVLSSYGQVADHISRSIRTTLSARAQGIISRRGQGDISTGVGETVDARMSVNGMIGDETGFVPLHPDDVPTPFHELLNELIISFREQLPARYQPAVIPLTKEEGGLSAIYYSAISCLPYAHHGSLDNLVPFYDFCRQSGLKLSQIDGSVKLASSSGWFWPMNDVCIMTARPSIVTTDGAGRVHNDRGPCVKYPDDWAMHAVNGMIVPTRLISFLRERTFAAIAVERNVEIRRMMLDLYGVERFLRDSGAEMIHKDECGSLYVRTGAVSPDPVVFVCVLNSTPEPDGHYRQYFIRVPPTVRTAREAVAWTFGLTAEEYRPLRES